jgi:hypothetical protein
MGTDRGMSMSGDSQDRAEALDTDKLPTDSDDIDAEPEYPLDELLGADEFGVRPAEERFGEPIDERVERELPDPLVISLDDSEGDMEPSDEDLAAVEASLEEDTLDLTDVDVSELEQAAPDLGDEDDPVGVLVDTDSEDVTSIIDTERDAVATSVPDQELSAEEAAIHRTADPPMGRPGDGYVYSV